MHEKVRTISGSIRISVHVSLLFLLRPKCSLKFSQVPISLLTVFLELGQRLVKIAKNIYIVVEMIWKLLLLA